MQPISVIMMMMMMNHSLLITPIPAIVMMTNHSFLITLLVILYCKIKYIMYRIQPVSNCDNGEHIFVSPEQCMKKYLCGLCVFVNVIDQTREKFLSCLFIFRYSYKRWRMNDFDPRSFYLSKAPFKQYLYISCHSLFFASICCKLWHH